jgi:hypothetical protein
MVGLTTAQRKPPVKPRRNVLRDRLGAKYLWIPDQVGNDPDEIATGHLTGQGRIVAIGGKKDYYKRRQKNR